MESKNKISKPVIDDEEDEEEEKTVVKPNRNQRAVEVKQFSTTIKKQTADNMTFELTKFDTLLAKQIKSDFKEVFEKYGQDALIQATSRQQITFAEGNEPLRLEDEVEIREFLTKHSDNFSRLENI
jgi:hypothetical protein